MRFDATSRWKAGFTGDSNMVANQAICYETTRPYMAVIGYYGIFYYTACFYHCIVPDDGVFYNNAFRNLAIRTNDYGSVKASVLPNMAIITDNNGRRDSGTWLYVVTPEGIGQQLSGKIVVAYPTLKQVKVKVAVAVGLAYVYPVTF